MLAAISYIHKNKYKSLIKLSNKNLAYINAQQFIKLGQKKFQQART